MIVEIASTIGILPDNVKEKMLANVTEPLDKVKEAIEQRKEALKNKMQAQNIIILFWLCHRTYSSYAYK